MTPDKFSFKAVGVSFADRYPCNLHDLQADWDTSQGVGEVSLIREPDNEYDAQAVAVLAGGEIVGHVPREVAQFVGPMIDAGSRLRARGEVLVNPDHPDRPGLLVEVETVKEVLA